ncbi:hypothetical protein KBD33_02260 [Candidatus Gracilibacteria bacterium]|nr:hypothetical protein [Candidatus Gracilibacteria bacterium]
MTKTGLNQLASVSKLKKGILDEPQAISLIENVSMALNIDKNNLKALIIRESNGVPNIHESNGIQKKTSAKGVMQLTDRVFDDMNTNDERGRGKWFYQDNFKKIGDNLLLKLSHIKDSRTDIQGLVSVIKNLKSTSKGKEFNLGISKLKNIVVKEFKEGGYIANILLGSIYLDAMKDSGKKLEEKPKIEKELSLINIDQINPLLKSKKFKPVDQKILESFKNDLLKNSSKYDIFYQLYMYNGEDSKSSGAEHRILYALAIMLSSEQIREKTGNKLAMLHGELGNTLVA